MIINPDGSIEGQTFSGPDYKGDYPTPRYGQETYREYHQRVKNLKEEGFHLGDLTWNHWRDYCYGSPYNDAYMQDETITS
mgnify:CR=1 FL=1